MYNLFDCMWSIKERLISHPFRGLSGNPSKGSSRSRMALQRLKLSVHNIGKEHGRYFVTARLRDL